MIMKRIDWRIVLGGLLVLGGALGILEQFGLLKDASGFFWGFVFAVGGAGFLYVFLTNRPSWWAAFPAFALLGLAFSSFLPASLDGWGGLAFLGLLGLGFWLVYFTDRERWWAIIPGGVLVTLGVVSALDDLTGMETGGVFFLGLGLTFLLVAILPGVRQMAWAFIPAAALLVMGLLMGTPFFGLTDYIWPAALIVGGILLIFFYFRRERVE